MVKRPLRGVSSPSIGRHCQIVRGRPAETLTLPQLARKGGAHRVNDPGDGNNAWEGMIRSHVLRATAPTDGVHRLDGSGLLRSLR